MKMVRFFYLLDNVLYFPHYSSEEYFDSDEEYRLENRHDNSNEIEHTNDISIHNNILTGKKENSCTQNKGKFFLIFR